MRCEGFDFYVDSRNHEIIEERICEHYGLGSPQASGFNFRVEDTNGYEKDSISALKGNIFFSYTMSKARKGLHHVSILSAEVNKR